MAFTTINYDEGSDKENLGYESVEIHYGKPEKKKFFKSRNFVKDWFDLRKFQIMKLSDKEAYFTQSSSVDNFIMDGAPYDSAYLVTDEKQVSELCYGSNWYKLGIEFFVPKSTKPTWAELKEMCK